MLTIDRKNRREVAEITIQMRKDLFAAYKEVLSKPCPSQRIALYRTVKHPAPRYYVTPKSAADLFYEMANGNFSRYERMTPTRKRKYDSLFNLAIELSNRREFQGKSITYILEYAVKQPAPEFFIGWESFKKILRNSLRYGIDYNCNDAVIWNKENVRNKKEGKPIIVKKHTIRIDF